MNRNDENIFEPLKGQHKLRTYRDSLAGAFYFLTVCVDGKKEILLKEKFAQIIFNSLDFMEKEGWIKLICCIVMPTHIHIVIHLLEKKSLSKLMRSFKIFTARNINMILGKTGKFWQDQYYEHKIRKDESLWNIVDYCHNNPVRKGLVDDPEKYPYWKLCPENIFE